MCFFTTTETREVRHGVTDPPRHRSRYSAHPPPGVVRVPVEYRRSREYDTYRTSVDRVAYREPPRIEYATPRSSRGRVGEEDTYRRSVTFVRD
ncbi:uncharacterized protein BDZ99DRAFT_62931 [Mytilinidion resinicola]|uniref:Uncharacterized protein n=1 Tax=Mytilinidion resinicola TaxID=574789 RepID=A0A6A6YFU8_9PEZI|nr:uncharacterized protein BDZ99DRAFT_62931 [Mytilinidion resinicola]KAF2807696.1 hypothetical protein BDZ99DRAFT_62931 [Mytilinidion resinicola]